MIPQMSADEFRQPGLLALDSPAVLKAYGLFRVYGVLLIRGLHQPERLHRVREQFLTEYADYLHPREYDDATTVGDGRTMVSVRLTGEFGRPELFAPPELLPICQHSLSDEFVVGAMSVVAALPGAGPQHGHPDHQRLFGDDELEIRLPTYAMNVLTPLVDVDIRNGATVVHPGSHVVPVDDKKNVPGQAAQMRLGDTLLMDVRIWHSGLSHFGATVRPLLSTTYYRPWFRDASNHEKQPELRLDAATLETLEPEHRKLFADCRYKR